MFNYNSLFNVRAHYSLHLLVSLISLLSSRYAVKMLKSGPVGGGGENQRMSSPMLPPPVSWNMGTVRPRSSDQKHRQTYRVTTPPNMFYPELSPAMRWHLDHNQKMYNMQMFSHQFSDKFSDQYGESSVK